MEIISNPTVDEIKVAAKALINGYLVAFPTETVYGLGADALNEKAVSRIYSVKGRPTDHPLIVHLSSFDLISIWATVIPDSARKLAQEFWPGPLTLVLKRSDLAKNYITGSQNSVAIRVPKHPVANRLLHEFEKLGGSGLVAPSANKFGAVSPTTSLDVRDELGEHLLKNDFILDGGNCEYGIESTIIGFDGEIPQLLRPGSITVDQIEELLQIQVQKSEFNSQTRVSGNLQSHYSPRATVIVSGIPDKGEGFIALSQVQTPEGAVRLISPSTNLEYAQQLYQGFRLADKKNINRLIIIPPTGDGIADSILDRINKAANG